MNDPATLSKDQLVALLVRQDDELQALDSALQTKDDQLQAKDDVIRQLEQKNQDWELAYNKLWLVCSDN